MTEYSTFDGQYTAVIDRIDPTAGAVLLIESSNESGVIDERIIPIQDLPPSSVPGDVVTVEFVQGNIVTVTLESDDSRKRELSIGSLFDELSQDLPSDSKE